MDGGCVVIGAKDRTLLPTGIGDFADYTAENLLHRVLGKCPNLSSLGLRTTFSEDCPQRPDERRVFSRFDRAARHGRWG